MHATSPAVDKALDVIHERGHTQAAHEEADRIIEEESDNPSEDAEVFFELSMEI